MNGILAVLTVLHADSGVTALVPTQRIVAGVLTQGAALPSISVTLISTVDLNLPTPGATRFVTERVQVTVLAPTYKRQREVLAAVKRAAADRLNVPVTGIGNVSIHTDSAGPDFMNEDASIYLGSIDFRVKFTELR